MITKIVLLSKREFISHRRSRKLITIVRRRSENLKQEIMYGHVITVEEDQNLFVPRFITKKSAVVSSVCS